MNIFEPGEKTTSIEISKGWQGGGCEEENLGKVADSDFIWTTIAILKILIFKFKPLENIYSRFCSGFVLLSLLLGVGGARRHSGRRRDREAIGEYLYRLASTSHIL